MKYIFYLTCIFYLITSCNSKLEDNYFKLTISDQAKPIGLLPECIEVGSDGKLVILTSRFNKGKELHQRTYFIELNKTQLDSVKKLMLYLPELARIQNYDSTYFYKIKVDNIVNNKRASRMYLASPNNNASAALINYCKSLPEQNHRYTLKHSYYFNTDEICLEQQ